MAFTKFTKDPDAVLDYRWDWSDWLTAITDTIESVTFVPEDGITVDSSSHTDTTATAWISGGTAGSSYTVTCRIVTAGGRTDDRTCSFRIVEA